MELNWRLKERFENSQSVACHVDLRNFDVHEKVHRLRWPELEMTAADGNGGGNEDHEDSGIALNCVKFVPGIPQQVILKSRAVVVSCVIHTNTVV